MVLAAQCAHETGWGQFGGAVTPEHGNTCGLKIRNPVADEPDDHARFAISPDGYPRVGAIAHAHNLRLYCGLPVPADTPDPRVHAVLTAADLGDIVGVVPTVDGVRRKLVLGQPGVVRPDGVVRDAENVEADPAVEVDELPEGQCAVAPRRVRVELAEKRRGPRLHLELQLRRRAAIPGGEVVCAE